MKLLRYVGRYFLGVLFLFSGFVKAVDPLGSAYKFTDYFTAFKLNFLEGLALPLAIFLSAFELVLGLVLILGYQKKRTYWVLLIFMSFFTVLTLILALTNPVTDCGCFGDAIILTNWETFFKNVIFMIFVLILFGGRKQVRNVLSGSLETILIVLFFGGSFLLSFYSIKHLPVIDFRPYDVGTHIPDEIKIPEGAPVDEYETYLYYKNLLNGETEEFSLENYPTDTSRYEFVTSESKLIRKGYEPPIHDFGITSPDGMDYTDDVLVFSGYTLLMTSPDLEKADKGSLEEGNFWSALEKVASDFRFIPITSTAGEVLQSVRLETGTAYDFYAGDEIMLKTMVRSNPGFLMIKNGTIVGKWSHEDFPAFASWDSSWINLINEYEQGMDSEMTLLIEQGYLEAPVIDMVDFDKVAQPILATRLVKIADNRAWIIYWSFVILVILALQFIPQTKK